MFQQVTAKFLPSCIKFLCCIRSTSEKLRTHLANISTWEFPKCHTTTNTKQLGTKFEHVLRCKAQPNVSTMPLLHCFQEVLRISPGCVLSGPTHIFPPCLFDVNFVNGCQGCHTHSFCLQKCFVAGSVLLGTL